jgi:hypothetical protein
MTSAKPGATNGALSSADMTARLATLQDRFEDTRADVQAVVALRTAAGCDLTFWSEDARFTVSACRQVP